MPANAPDTIDLVVPRAAIGMLRGVCQEELDRLHWHRQTMPKACMGFQDALDTYASYLIDLRDQLSATLGV